MSRRSRGQSRRGKRAKTPRATSGAAQAHPPQADFSEPRSPVRVATESFRTESLSTLAVRRPPPDATAMSWVLTAYVCLLCGGFALLRSPLATVRGNELSIDRAAFTAINAVALTGFEQAVGIGELTPAGQFTVFVLVTAGTLLSLIVGAILVCSIARLPYTNRQITVGSAALVLTAAVLGLVGLSSSSGGAWSGVFQGVSALGNSGMYLGRIGGAQNVSTHLLLLPLSIAGGLGLPVLIDAWNASTKRSRPARHTVVVLVMSAVFYVAGFFAILVAQFATAHLSAADLTLASAAALNSRSAGFPLEPIEHLARASQWILMGLMFIGAAPGGTGGGLKVTTPFVLYTGVRNALAGRMVGRSVGIAGIWTVTYLLLVAGGLLILLNTEPQTPADRLLFITISAASGVGLAHDPVSMVGPGLDTLGIVALLGRLLPLLVLWWMASSATDGDVAVG